MNNDVYQGGDTLKGRPHRTGFRDHCSTEFLGDQTTCSFCDKLQQTTHRMLLFYDAVRYDRVGLQLLVEDALDRGPQRLPVLGGCGE